MGAAHSAAADPQSVGGQYPDSIAGQNTRLPDALHARLFVDRPALRRVCRNLDIPAYGSAPSTSPAIRQRARYQARTDNCNTVRRTLSSLMIWGVQTGRITRSVSDISQKRKYPTRTNLIGNSIGMVATSSPRKVAGGMTDVDSSKSVYTVLNHVISSMCRDGDLQNTLPMPE